MSDGFPKPGRLNGKNKDKITDWSALKLGKFCQVGQILPIGGVQSGKSLLQKGPPCLIL